MGEMLARLGLDTHAEALMEEGYDDLGMLGQLEEGELTQILIEDVGMAEEDAKRVVASRGEWKA